jgi:hypothetical protein
MRLIPYSGKVNGHREICQGKSIYFGLKGKGKRTTRKDFRKK